MASGRNQLFFAIQGALKYVPFAWGAVARRWLYRPFFAEVGRGLTVHDNVTIKYPDEIRLGHHVTINTGCFVVGLGGLSIGNDVMLGAGTKIVTTTHGRSTGEPMQRQPLETTSILIEDDVWFGFDVKVLPGSTIRKGAVLGAGSVVTGEIPAYAVAVGMPAKVIRSRV